MLQSGNQQGVHGLGTVRKVKEQAEMKLQDSKHNQLQQVTVSQQVCLHASQLNLPSLCQ